MAECSKCINNAVCKTADSCDGYVSGFEHFNQWWISVKEMLPQNFISVLGYMTDAGDFPPVRECYTVGNAFFFPALADIHPVSHWMPLPEAPKGE